jgi:hypothetical protein
MQPSLAEAHATSQEPSLVAQHSLRSVVAQSCEDFPFVTGIRSDAAVKVLHRKPLRGTANLAHAIATFGLELSGIVALDLGATAAGAALWASARRAPPPPRAAPPSPVRPATLPTMQRSSALAVRPTSKAVTSQVSL